jgi:hypothetical protein
LAIYYCYTHESFTENFKSVADIVKGGVIEFFQSVADSTKGPLTVNGNLTTTGEIITSSTITGGAVKYKNSKDGFSYILFPAEATNIGGITPSALNLHAYNGSGGWMAHIASFRNNGTTDFSKINVAGRDILAEIDALKAGSAGNANKGGTDTNKSIEDLGKLAAQLLNSGNLTVPGAIVADYLSLGGNINFGTKGKKSSYMKGGDDYLRFGIAGNDVFTVSAVDCYLPHIHTSGLNASGKLTASSAIINGRDILAELDALKANTIKVNDQIKLNITGDPIGAAAGRMYVGARDPAAGDGVYIVATNERGRQLGLTVNRF